MAKLKESFYLPELCILLSPELYAEGKKTNLHFVSSAADKVGI